MMGNLIWNLVVSIMGMAFAVFILSAGVALLVLADVVTAEEIRDWVTRRKRGGKKHDA